MNSHIFAVIPDTTTLNPFFLTPCPILEDHECWAALTELSFLCSAAPRQFWRLARRQLLVLYVTPGPVGMG
jgi:hypothetical protein